MERGTKRDFGGKGLPKVFIFTGGGKQFNLSILTMSKSWYWKCLSSEM